MSLNDLIAVALSFLAALFTSWFLLLPLLEETKVDSSDLDDQNRKIEDLILLKERALGALEDLESDYLSELVEDEVYVASKNELQNQVASSLSELKEIRK